MKICTNAEGLKFVGLQFKAEELKGSPNRPLRDDCSSTQWQTTPLGGGRESAGESCIPKSSLTCWVNTRFVPLGSYVLVEASTGFADRLREQPTSSRLVMLEKCLDFFFPLSLSLSFLVLPRLSSIWMCVPSTRVLRGHVCRRCFSTRILSSDICATQPC